MESPEQHDQKEPFDMGIVAYFVRIMRTLFIGFFWMMINVFFGLYLGFAVPEESTPGRMIFFYSWFVISLAGYLYLVYRLWRKKAPVQDNYK
ncbi:hypothetical protein GO495_27180 [Chitinophaga oryziterrae]|jgi:hypothetical protein|uniref:Uncharacterized protein n=1 Tax=Chitinophaga oryziterrae TaxID=1031224 RepID=A0A6N8JJ63_9BACT|nr:hypothetical protein [Chitinophaga oryziterrae]MVT44308.1 hypothetical protein [Chitinophaga oryziterrae]